MIVDNLDPFDPINQVLADWPSDSNRRTKFDQCQKVLSFKTAKPGSRLPKRVNRHYMPTPDIITLIQPKFKLTLPVKYKCTLLIILKALALSLAIELNERTGYADYTTANNFCNRE